MASKKRVIKAFIRPHQKFFKYKTEFYTSYFSDAAVPEVIGGPFKNFGQYDNYPFYSNLDINSGGLESIPKAGIRLDDLAIARVLVVSYRAKDMNKNWPAEFDV